MSSWAAKTLIVFEKELRTEYRARYAVNSMLLFCITCAAVASFALGGRVEDIRVQAALLWIVIFFSAMSGLSRSFVKEHEAGTMQLLRVSCEPGPVFFGKALFNLALTLGALVVLTALFILFLGMELKSAGFFAAGAALASISVSVLCTLISAIVSGARARGTLFPILSFPILLPVFATAVQSTKLSLEGAKMMENLDTLGFLGGYAGASIIVCSFLFDFLFYD